MIFYSATTRSSGKVDLANVNATAKYLQHAGNVLHLQALSKASQNYAVRCDLESEITIGARKMAYWERHDNFNAANAGEGIRAMKRALNWKKAA